MVGRTKTNVPVETLASDDSSYITSRMRNKLFSVVTDGSNDTDNIKLYPVTVRYVYLVFYMGDNVGF